MDSFFKRIQNKWDADNSISKPNLSDRDLIDIRNQASGDTEMFKVINNILKQTRGRTKADITRWKDAIALAEDSENPQRWALQDLYKDAVLDQHLSSIMQTRSLFVSGTEFKIVDKNTGEEDEEKTRLLETSWFHKYLSLYLESRFFGASLIELGTPVEGQIVDVKLVPRTNYIPEKRLITYEVGDDKGISIDDPEWVDWLVENGDCEDFGFLYKIVPLTIMKRNAMWAWTEFQEIFGMPFRWATTTSRDKAIREGISDMLSEMGQAAHGVFDEGVEINFAQQKHADAHEVYNKFIDRVNSEISKGLFGQTMTSDDGSSKSQGEVHLGVAEKYIANDRKETSFHLNGEFFKKLIIHGYPFENVEFKWDLESSVKPEERIKIDSEISKMGYTPTKEYLEKNYNIELEEGNANAPTQNIKFADLAATIKNSYE